MDLRFRDLADPRVRDCGNPRGEELLQYTKDRYYRHFACQGIANAQVRIVPGLSPAVEAMELVKAQEAVEGIRRFLGE